MSLQKKDRRIFPRKLQQTWGPQYYCLIERLFSYKTLFLRIVIAIWQYIFEIKEQEFLYRYHKNLYHRRWSTFSQQQWWHRCQEIIVPSPSFNDPIRVDKLMKMLFLSCVDNCIEYVTYIAVATIETYYPPPNCAHTLYSVSLKV